MKDLKVGDVVTWCGSGLGARKWRTGRIARISFNTAEVRSEGRLYKPYMRWLQLAEKMPEQKMREAAPSLYLALYNLLEARWMCSVEWAPAADYEAICEDARKALAHARGES